MHVSNIGDYQGGWFVGDFPDSALRHRGVEVAYKVHQRDEHIVAHIHDKADEINYLIDGLMVVNGQLLRSGAVFVIPAREVAVANCLSDCRLVVVKVPSVPGDKRLVDVPFLGSTPTHHDLIPLRAYAWAIADRHREYLIKGGSTAAYDGLVVAIIQALRGDEHGQSVSAGR